MRVVDLDGGEVPQGDTGEIQIRGHNVMKGYWNLPDATRATITPDGWLTPATSDASTRTATSTSSTGPRT